MRAGWEEGRAEDWLQWWIDNAFSLTLEFKIHLRGAVRVHGACTAENATKGSLVKASKFTVSGI